VDDRLDATDGDNRAAGEHGKVDQPAEGIDETSPGRRWIRWTVGIVTAGTLVFAVLPIFDGDGLSERTAIGRIVSAATAGGYALADEVLPALTAMPTDAATGSPSPRPAPTSTTPTPTEPPPQDEWTLFGTSLDFTVGGGFEGWVDHVDDRFGTLPVVRAFNPALPRPWSATDNVAGRTVVVSFKASPQRVTSGDLDKRLREWFTSAPDTGEIYWTYFHEPEDNIASGQFTAEEFREAWKHIHGIAEEVGKENQFATLILMGWTTNPSSKRDFNDYYPGDEYVDVLGWDSYNFGHRQGQYVDPEDLFDRVISLSEELGKPWGIAETGSLIVDGDDGSGRAAWLSRVGAYLNDRGALWVTYFESTVGADYRLHDEESRQAWSELVRASARGG
jgi:hypothetical protein